MKQSCVLYEPACSCQRSTRRAWTPSASDAVDFSTQRIPARIWRCPAQCPVSLCLSKAPLSSCKIETSQRDVDLADTGSRDVLVVGTRKGVQYGFGCLDRS